MNAASRLDGARVQRGAAWTVRLVMAFGVLCLAPKGGVPAVTAFGGLALMALGWAVNRPGLWETAWRLANAVAAVLALVLVFLLGRPWGEVAMLLVVYLMIHRAWTAALPGDHRVALLLSYLVLLLGSTLSDSAWLAPLHVGMVALLPLALLLLHTWDVQLLRPARGATLFTPRRGAGLAATAVALFAVSAGVFLSLPRLQAGAMARWGAATSVSGFSDEVSLGDLGAIQTNPTPVMQVEARAFGSEEPILPPLRMRGVALDAFDGEAWRRSGVVVPWQVPDRPRGERAGDIRQDVLLEPLGERVLFGLPRVLAMRTEGLTLLGQEPKNVRHMGEPRRMSYRVWSRPVAAGPEVLREASRAHRLNPRAQRHFTRLPEGLDPQVVELARRLTVGATTPYDKAVALERHLRENYTYTDVPEAGTLGQPVVDFLFETRRGHCEYFATALAVLLRATGVPANVVNGFYGGEWNELTGFVTLRQSDAHSWVEAYLGTAGWVSFDATPEATAPPARGWWSQAADAMTRAWRQQVVDFDLGDQLALMNLPDFDAGATSGWAPAAPLVPVGALLVLVGVLPGLVRSLVLRPRRTRSRQGLEGVLQRAWRLVARRGYQVPIGLPPQAAADWLVARAGATAEPLQWIADCHYRARYGGEDEDRLLPEARRHLSALRSLPRAS